MPPPAPLHKDSIRLHGWQISTVKGPIISDRDTAAFRYKQETYCHVCISHGCAIQPVV